MIKVNENICLPESVLYLSYSRSSGPGGQHVNKSNTKVTLRWNVKRTTRLPNAAKLRLIEAEKNRINLKGELLIVSEKHREQSRNIEECKKLLKKIILKSLKTKKKRKRTKPSRAAVEKRISAKKIAGTKKQLRKSPKVED